VKFYWLPPFYNNVWLELEGVTDIIFVEAEVASFGEEALPPLSLEGSKLMPASD
jgi:hypothetical protein